MGLPSFCEITKISEENCIVCTKSHASIRCIKTKLNLKKAVFMVTNSLSMIQESLEDQLWSPQGKSLSTPARIFIGYLRENWWRQTKNLASARFVPLAIKFLRKYRWNLDLRSPEQGEYLIEILSQEHSREVQSVFTKQFDIIVKERIRGKLSAESARNLYTTPSILPWSTGNGRNQELNSLAQTATSNPSSQHLLLL